MSWRKKAKFNLPENEEELLVRFEYLIDSIVDLAMGREINSKLIHHKFYKRLSYILFGQTTAWTSYTLTLIRTLIDKSPSIEEDDIRQQAIIYLLQMWQHYKKRKPKKGKFVFYDYVRFNLVNYVADHIADLIKVENASILTVEEETVEIEEPNLPVNMGWVMLRVNAGIFSILTVRQRYLVYLRYQKKLSNLEISDLTHRHVSSIEKDFKQIKDTLSTGVNNVLSKLYC